MTNEAKFGLVIGVGLVILIAVLFFRRDVAITHAAPETSFTARTGSLPSPTITHKGPYKARLVGREHTVADGDTLFSLAQRYYADSGKFVAIYEANREALAAPDRLMPGTVLLIPQD